MLLLVEMAGLNKYFVHFFGIIFIVGRASHAYGVIIAEVKNKHNTVTGSKLVDVYKGLESLVMPNGQIYKGYTAYYVEIVPKKPVRVNITFTPSDPRTSTRCSPNEKIRKIDGASFYTLVTGVEDALEQVYNSLPKVIKDLQPNFDVASSRGADNYYKKAYVSPR
jgi:hypothetical protein